LGLTVVKRQLLKFGDQSRPKRIQFLGGVHLGVQELSTESSSITGPVCPVQAGVCYLDRDWTEELESEFKVAGDGDKLMEMVTVKVVKDFDRRGVREPLVCKADV
jgi:hypothetical protein